MAISEKPLTGDIQALIPGAAKEGAQLVGVSHTEAPLKIVEAINTFVANPPKKKMFKRVDHWNDHALPLGALWGMQMARQFGWSWALFEENGETSIGIFDLQRSKGIYPFDYIFGCLEAGEYPTILLAFNMLIEGGIPDFAPRSTINVMDGVQHIVPPL